MNPNRRKYLLIAFAAMLVFTAGDRAWVTYYETPINELQTRASQYVRQVRKTQQAVEAHRKKQQALVVYESRSLPGDPEVARTLYQGWLNGLAERLELVGPRVDSTSPRGQHGFRVLPFSLRATATVNQLTQLLDDFYRANTIHRIRTLTISPIDRGNRIAFSISIEALLVDSTTQRESLPEGVSDELALPDVRDYRVIALRNIFSPNGGAGALDGTYLTAIVSVDGVAEAWFSIDEQVDSLKIREGDVLEMAGLFARVTKIGEAEIFLDSPDGSLKLELNKPLSEAEAVPASDRPPELAGSRA